MKNFSLIGVAGYIASKHLNAIKETGNNLISALDPNDSVGILDNFFPNSLFFKEFERFDRHVFKLSKIKEEKINYISICSPNYLHDSHIRFALRSGADAICEKPLVLNLWNLEGLRDLEDKTGNKINSILQLRNHKEIIKLKNKISKSKITKNYNIDLTYITPRGNWYAQSWKGDVNKSGGIVTNIGIHLFDMLHYLFGKTKKSKLFLKKDEKQSGFLELENANVRWFLSIDYNDLPLICKKNKVKTFRSISIDGKEIEFSKGFTDLHTLSYEQILNGKGFGIDENINAIETASNIRSAKTVPLVGEYHPLINKKLF